MKRGDKRQLAILHHRGGGRGGKVANGRDAQFVQPTKSCAFANSYRVLWLRLENGACLARQIRASGPQEAWRAPRAQMILATQYVHHA
eukprot:scaffold38415_cov18-Prasinocladus_malaysianus.AAC.1